MNLTPEQFDSFLAVARRHKVIAFEVGDLKVSLHVSALVDDTQKQAPSEHREPVSPIVAGEDPDLFASVLS